MIISGRVRVMMRDIVSDQERGRQQRFLKEYQALAGYILEGSKSFEDYLSGGYEILKGKSEEAGLFEPETVREEKAFLSSIWNRCWRRKSGTCAGWEKDGIKG